MVLLRQLLGDVLRRLRIRQGRTLREVSASARVSLGYLAGSWADRRWHTAPWLSLVGLFLGISAGFRELWRLVQQHRSQSDNGPKDGTAS